MYCRLFSYIYIYQPIGLVGRVFINSPEDWGEDQVVPKTPKMVLDASLLNAQHYKVKGKVGQYRERSSALPYTLVL